MSKLNMKYSNFVSRNEAINALLKQERLTPSIIRRVLMQIKGVDAVEVVRCKDCNYRHDSCFAGNSNIYCNLKRAYFPLDGFCSYGEPKYEEMLDEISYDEPADCDCCSEEVTYTTEVDTHKCPQCGESTVFTEGCVSCKSCGWSKC